MKKICLLLLVSALSLSGFAELTLPTVLSDHMVLQQKQSVPIWGKADPGSKITVEFAGQKKTTVAGDSGKWQVLLDPMPASSEPRKMIIHSSLDTGPLTLSDVLVGEVWLCSGQSNMQFSMERTVDGAEAVAAANCPLIRLYDTPRVPADEPKEKIDSTWEICTPETVKTFSAVAYYFARKLQAELDVPVGLLLSCWGGTYIEPWIPPCGFEGIDSLAAIRKQIDPKPTLSGNVRADRQVPTALYNGMLAAHIPFAIKGSIWYQGESNHKEGMLYVDKTRALLNGWHKLWGYDFPYYFVQIAPYQYGEENPEILPIFWEAQSEIVKQIPNTGMAVITDVATLDNIHPPNKKDPGTRLALLALNNTYGKDIVSTGPTFDNMKIDGNKVVVTFSSADGLTTRDGKAPNWFEIGGKEGVFKPANAEIKGNSIILTSPDVPEPLAMRFAWNKLAEPNLMNGAGLPASAFRAGRLPEPKMPDPIQIPEMKGYRTIYQLNIPVDAGYATVLPKYDIDNSGDSKSFKKIAYCLELMKPGGNVQYAFASMDAFTDDLKKISVPTVLSDFHAFEKIDNLTVRSNVDGVMEVTDSDGGNIEFWPGNYGPQNSSRIPGAEDKYDFGDAPSSKVPGYACMQVHNWKDRQTVFAINHWNAGTVDIGIGNSEGKTADWTFAANAPDYVLRRLTVMVK